MLIAGCARKQPMDGPEKDPQGAFKDQLSNLSSMEGLPGDELWIIELAHDIAPPSRTSHLSAGAVVVVRPGVNEPIPTALKSTHVQSHVHGAFATARITQTFQNPHAESVAASYLFPLPRHAAVYDFLIQIADRRIRGVIGKKNRAEQIYAEATEQGYLVTLLKQEGAFFHQPIGNLPPSASLQVEIQYLHPVVFTKGEFEFRVPLTSNPTFHLPAAEEWPWPKPVHSPTRSSLVLTTELNTGSPIESVYSPSHEISVERIDRTSARIDLVPTPTALTQDFVLRYSMESGLDGANLTVQEDAHGGFFLLLVPPAALSNPAVDWGANEVRDVFPSKIPARIKDRPLVLMGRFDGRWKSDVFITVERDGVTHRHRLSRRSDRYPELAQTLPAFWARLRIADLLSMKQNRKREQAIEDLALEFGILSPQTTFLVTDTLTRSRP